MRQFSRSNLPVYRTLVLVVIAIAVVQGRAGAADGLFVRFRMLLPDKTTYFVRVGLLRSQIALANFTYEPIEQFQVWARRPAKARPRSFC